MSRVLLIGSPREKGNTAYLIGEFGRALVGKARAAIGIRRRPGRAPVHDDVELDAHRIEKPENCQERL